jgi:prepilin-type N-terminal cleavage/methylation domain-containing protein
MTTNSNHGFTLIGLLVALAIVGWLWVMKAHQRTPSPIEAAATIENHIENPQRGVTTMELKQHVQDKLQESTERLKQREQTLQTE